MLKRTASVVSVPLSLAMAFAIALFAACSGDSSNNSSSGESSSSGAYVRPSSIVQNLNVILSLNLTLRDIEGTKHENLTATVSYFANEDNSEVASNNGLDSVVLRLDGVTKKTQEKRMNGSFSENFQFGDNDYCDNNAHDVCVSAYFKNEEADRKCDTFTRGLVYCKPPSSSSTTPSSSSQAVVRNFSLCIETELNSTKNPRGVRLGGTCEAMDQASADVWLTTAGTLQVKEGAGIADIVGKTSADVASPFNTGQFALPTKSADWLQETDYTIWGNDGQYSAIRLNKSQPIEWNSNSYLILPVEDMAGSGGNKTGKVKIWKVN